MTQYRDRNRQKAFLGAVIGAGLSIAGGIVKGNKQKKEARRQQALQDHKDALQNAQALSSAYANQDYVDQYNDKFVLKCGGKIRQYKGRRKAALGLWEDGDLSSMLSGAGNLASAVTGYNGLNVLGATIGSAAQTTNNRKIAEQAARVKQTPVITNQAPAQIVNSYRSNFLDKYKCGGRKKAFVGSIISAAGNIIGGIFGSKGSNQQVQADDVSVYSAPKTGLVVPNWKQNQVQPPVQPTYGTPIQPRYFYGGRKRR